MEFIILVLSLVVIVLVLMVNSISTSTTHEQEPPVTAEEFINEATGVDLFPTDKG